MDYTRKKGGSGVIINPANRLTFDRYISESARLKPLSREEEVALFKHIEATNDRSAIEKICRHNLLFVVSVARRYAESVTASNSLSLEDLVSEGNMGLYEAIATFDYNTNNKFISFAVWKIRQRILSSIQNNSKTIRIPHNVYKEFVKIRKAKLEMDQKVGGHADLSDVFDKMVESGDTNGKDTYLRLVNIEKAAEFEKSLNTSIGDDSDEDWMETLKSKEDNIDAVILKTEKYNFAHSLLNQIPKDDLKYFIDYYGFYDQEKLTIVQMAQKYGVSESYIKLKIDKYLRALSRENKKTAEEYFD
jgi:RNA polymerase primary sigma factor